MVLIQVWFDGQDSLTGISKPGFKVDVDLSQYALVLSFSLRFQEGQLLTELFSPPIFIVDPV